MMCPNDPDVGLEMTSYRELEVVKKDCTISKAAQKV
jgi:hypothetical protein